MIDGKVPDHTAQTWEDVRWRFLFCKKAQTNSDELIHKILRDFTGPSVGWTVRETLGDAAFQTACQAGAQMTMEEMIAFAHAPG